MQVMCISGAMAKPSSKLSTKDQFSVDTVEKVVRTVTPEMIANGLAEALEATTTNREGTFPDYRVRLQALQLVIETTIGKPIQRQEIITKSIRSDEETWDAISKSPAALAALRKRLEEAERKLELKQVIDVGNASENPLS